MSTMDLRSTAESELVLHLAAEGGSLKLWRASQQGHALYLWEKNSALVHELLLEEDAALAAIEPLEQSLPVHSFAAAIDQLRQFPYWRHMHLVELQCDHAKQLLLLWHRCADETNVTDQPAGSNDH